MNRTKATLPHQSRRSFLRSSLAVAAPMIAAPVFGAAPAASTANREGQGLTVYQLGPIIWVRWNNRALLAYRAHQSQKYPYVYPVSGPATGLSLTSEMALPWPHHRSLFFGCDRVNGSNYWQEDFATGQIVSGGPVAGPVKGNTIEIRDTTEWRKPNEPPVMRDDRVVRIAVSGETAWSIEWEIKWTALVDVTVQKTNHSLFSLRAAPDITPWGGGTLVNAEGRLGEKATFGQPSAWCDYHGRRNGLPDAPIEGIALFDHPKNPWSPCPWFTRDYGFISPTPLNFREEPWKLASGKSVTLRYLVVAHTGDPDQADLAGRYAEWASRSA